MIYYIVNSADIQISKYYGMYKEALDNMKSREDRYVLTIRSAEGNIEDADYYYLVRKRVMILDTLKSTIIYCICNCSGVEVAPRTESEDEARRVLDLMRKNQSLDV